MEIGTIIIIIIIIISITNIIIIIIIININIIIRKSKGDSSPRDINKDYPAARQCQQDHRRPGVEDQGTGASPAG